MEKGKKHPEMKTREKLLTAQQKETMGNCPNNVQFRKKKKCSVKPSIFSFNIAAMSSSSMSNTDRRAIAISCSYFSW